MTKDWWKVLRKAGEQRNSACKVTQTKKQPHSHSVFPLGLSLLEYFSPDGISRPRDATTCLCSFCLLRFFFSFLNQLHLNPHSHRC